MLEDALSNVYGPHFQTLDRYVGDHFQLYKLHGSVDWGHTVNVPIVLTKDPTRIHNYLYDNAGDYPLGPIVKIPPGAFNTHDHGAVPAIAIPVDRKSDFECPASLVDDLATIIRTQNVKVLTVSASPGPHRSRSSRVPIRSSRSS